MDAFTKLQGLEVELGSGWVFRCTADWRLDAGWAKALADYDLWFVSGGLGRMVTSDGPVDLYPGRGVWMRPGRRYEVTQDLQAMLRVTVLHFRLRTKTRLLPIADFTPPVEVFDYAAVDYFGAALAHVVDLRARRPALAAQVFKALLLEIVADHAEAKPAGALRRHHQMKLGPVIALIRESPERRFTVEELAARTGYATDHFVRLFRGLTGQSPKAFMIRQRMERALTLLRESSQTVTQIAEALGYDDLGFFSRQFTAEIGISPGRFRRKSEAKSL